MSSEKPKFREGMERLTKHLVESGMSAEQARKQARESAIRADRRSRGQSNPRKRRELKEE